MTNGYILYNTLKPTSSDSSLFIQLWPVSVSVSVMFETVPTYIINYFPKSITTR